MLERDRFVVYGGTGHHSFDAAVLRLFNATTGLGLDFSHCAHSTWPDGEPGFRIVKPKKIRGRHVIIFSCPVSPKLRDELKDLIVASKQQYGARTVTVILSFLCFRRHDHDEFEHEITRLRWFIRDLKNWGADNLVVCEPHSPERTQKYCDEFELTLYIADPTAIFADALKGVVQTWGGRDRVRIYSPDFGSVGRAIALAKRLGLSVVATPKQRKNTRVEVVSFKNFLREVRRHYGTEVPVSCNIKDVRRFHILMREDEVDSGTTAVTTARYVRENGALTVSLVATHPVCSRGWKIRLFPEGEENPFRQIWFGNTRPRGDGETEYEGSTGGAVEKVDVSPCVAQALLEAISNLKD